MADKTRKCKGPCGRNRAERFFTSARGNLCSDCRRQSSSSSSRSVRLMNTYGITLDDYEAILAAQGGSCAICWRTPRYNMDVDHDHKLERELIAQGMAEPMARRASVRGLLCKLCNRRVLPSVRDDVPSLQRAITYLQSPPAFPLLGSPLAREGYTP